MLFALSVLDFRRKDTKFPRQIEQFFPFFSPFNILCRLLPHTPLTELSPNGYKNRRAISRCLGGYYSVCGGMFCALLYACGLVLVVHAGVPEADDVNGIVINAVH